jgi:hypothetical protein
MFQTGEMVMATYDEMMQAKSANMKAAFLQVAGVEPGKYMIGDEKVVLANAAMMVLMAAIVTVVPEERPGLLKVVRANLKMIETGEIYGTDRP